MIVADMSEIELFVLWIEEGHDSEMFAWTEPITQEDIEWARNG